MTATGSFAEESAKLFAALQDWAAKGRLAAASMAEDGAAHAAGAHGSGGPDGHQAAECHLCPVCQGLAMMRGQRPEVLEHLSDALAALAAAATELFPRDGADGQGRQGPREGRVEHIDVTGDDPAPADPGVAARGERHDRPGDAGPAASWA